MAFVDYDYYSILSDGMYFGATEEASSTDKERFTRISSHGLLTIAPTPPSFTGEESGGLNDVGTSTTL